MTVKLGFIGVGGISRSHLRDIQAMPEEAEVVGMVDVNREQAEMMAKENGAIGGKLIGAGGGGFIMFYTEDKARLRHAMNQAGLKEVRFQFDFEGTKTIIS